MVTETLNWFKHLFYKIVPPKNVRDLRKVQPIIDEINLLEYRYLSETELHELTDLCRNRIDTEEISAILPGLQRLPATTLQEMTERTRRELSAQKTLADLFPDIFQVKTDEELTRQTRIFRKELRDFVFTEFELSDKLSERLQVGLRTKILCFHWFQRIGHHDDEFLSVEEAEALEAFLGSILAIEPWRLFDETLIERVTELTAAIEAEKGTRFSPERIEEFRQVLSDIVQEPEETFLTERSLDRVRFFVEEKLLAAQKGNKTSIQRHRVLDLLEDMVFGIENETVRSGWGNVFLGSRLQQLKHYFSGVVAPEVREKLDRALITGQIPDGLDETTQETAEFLAGLLTPELRKHIRENQAEPLRHFFDALFSEELIASVLDLMPDRENASPEKLEEEVNEAVEAYLEKILPHAAAIVRAAAKRRLGMRHFDVQLIGGIFLHRGNIAEMKTGEGKTLAATLPAYLNAIPGRGVHIVTVNDYLARRDRDWMSPVYELLGLTSGVIQHDMSNAERRKNYACDITYGTNNEFGFDYLRDNLKSNLDDCVQKEHNYAIVDEVDSILIDEARTPLIISGEVERDTHRYDQFKPMVDRLVREQQTRVQKIFQEALAYDETDPDSEEKYYKLLKVSYGAPKFRPLLDYIADPAHKETQKRLNRLEAELLQAKQLGDLEEGLLYMVTEKERNVDLTDEGRSRLSQPPWFRPLLKEFWGELHRIEHTPDLPPKEKAKAKKALVERFATSKAYGKGDLFDLAELYEAVSQILADASISPVQRERAIHAVSLEFEGKNRNLKNISFEKFSDFFDLFQERAEVEANPRLKEEERQARLEAIEKELTKITMGDLFVLPDLDVDLHKIEQDKQATLAFLAEELSTLESLFDREIQETQGKGETEGKRPDLLVPLVRGLWKDLVSIDDDEEISPHQKEEAKARRLAHYHAMIHRIGEGVHQLYQIRRGEREGSEATITNELRELAARLPALSGLIERIFDIKEGRESGEKEKIGRLIEKKRKELLELRTILVSIFETLSREEGKATEALEALIEKERKTLQTLERIFGEIGKAHKTRSKQEVAEIRALLTQAPELFTKGAQFYEAFRKATASLPTFPQLLARLDAEQNRKARKQHLGALRQYLEAAIATLQSHGVDEETLTHAIRFSNPHGAFEPQPGETAIPIDRGAAAIRDLQPSQIEGWIDALAAEDGGNTVLRGQLKNLSRLYERIRAEEILEQVRKDYPEFEALGSLSLPTLLEHFHHALALERDVTLSAVERAQKRYELNRQEREICGLDRLGKNERMEQLLFEKAVFQKAFEARRRRMEERYEKRKEALLREFDEKQEKVHNIQQLLRAYTLFERDVDYVVMPGERGEAQVIIVDEFTGRLMPGRRYSDGLHQAIEAKEGVKIAKASQTVATITLQNYFRMYRKLAGMTGTADTEAAEFHKIYGLDVNVIPTNEPMIRVDHPDVIYRTAEEKFEAVVREIIEFYLIGRPVLVGTTSVEASERLSRMLDFRPLRGCNPQGMKVVHEVAHEMTRDAEIREEIFRIVFHNIEVEIGKAHRKGGAAFGKIAEVLAAYLYPTKGEAREREEAADLLRTRLEEGIHTAPDLLALSHGGMTLLDRFRKRFLDNIREKVEIVEAEKKIPHEVLNAKHHEKEAQIVKKAGQKDAVTIATNMAGRGTDIVLADEVKYILGGLHILGTERHESRRIDNQLRGRAGRQGDPGSSRFYLSLEDDLMRIFVSDRVGNIMERLGMERGVPIEHKLVSRAIENAQKKVEGRNFEIRKRLLDYDDVNNKQREVIYGKRNQIIRTRNVKRFLFEMVEEVIENLIDDFAAGESPDTWEIAGLKQTLQEKFRLYEPLDDLDKLSSHEELFDRIYEAFAETYRKKEVEFKEYVTKGTGYQLTEIVRREMLATIDAHWMDHLLVMDQIKEGIGLRGYGQRDPLVEYKKEGYNAFMEMMSKINRQVVERIFQISFARGAAPKKGSTATRTREVSGEVEQASKQKDQKKLQNLRANTSESNVKKKPVVRKEKKVGRNEPCPCGSGKKYKKCCGR